LIEAQYRVDRRRQALFGHSYGGLFVLHTLFARPAAFQTYVAASPSIWWGGRFVLTQLPAALDGAAGAPRVLLTVGALEQAAPGADASPRGLMLAEKRMVDAARELAATLQARPGGAGRVAFAAFDGEDHGSALFPALSRGLAFFMENK
jgi:predicted alpha/beta superfamily hydrolase